MIFVYFNNPQPVELHGTHGGSGVTLSQEAGVGATGHVTVLELPQAKRRELEPWDMWLPQSCLEPGGGA
jgi:hypothetical protein